MPRIDPQQLLSCLTPLLAVNGGIKSSGEVIRLANLMQKYSKKLVSKCIYVQILKCTETELLGQFMAANGWNLVHTWLNDSVNSANWPFVQEILEMLLLCPVDSNRLKSNHTPKIVKSLSMNTSQNAMITALSKKLVEQWLKIAHQEKQMLEQQTNGMNGSSNSSENVNITENGSVKNNESSNENDVIKTMENNTFNGTVSTNDDNEISKKSSCESIKYKISNKDSGLVLSIKRSTSPLHDHEQTKPHEGKIKSEHKSKSSSSSSSSSSDKDKDKDKDKEKERSKKSSSSSSSHKSSSSSSSSKSSHRDKDRSSSHKSSSGKDRHHSSSKSSSSSSKSSSSSSRDRDRDKKKRDIEKEQAEKDKETLSFLTPLSSNKLQRIPKRQHNDTTSESESSSKNPKSSEVVEKKKPSISIENRKGEKPKTVKTLNSQFRNHGLAEEPPPPPSRKTLKKPASNTVILPPPTVSPSTTLTSLSLSSKSISPPPSKKLHLALEPDVPERAGGVKLIKPKPMLVESTGFLDALDASAFLNKKDSKKRKRLPSGSSNSTTKKDEPESPKIEVKPLKFYKDTLEESVDEEKDKEKHSLTSNSSEIESPTKELNISIDIKNDNKGDNNDDESKADDSVTDKKSEESSSTGSTHSEKRIKVDEENENEPEEKRPPGIGTGPDGPPGIIFNPNNPRRKRTKRSIRWRSDDELVDIHYFPLEENERVNVTKTFMEQKHMEHIHERNALLGRRQDEQTSWRTLIVIDNVPEIQYGSKSLEAKIQMEREKNTLQEVFFDGRSMSDSPQEPDPEHYDMTEPAVIPLEDVTGNTDSITSFKDIAWPAPKGDQPQYVSHGGFGNIFNSIGANISIPSAPVLSATAAAAAINPLAGLNLSSIQPHDNSPLNFMGIIQSAAGAAAGIAPFMQPPPMIQNNYQSNNAFNSRATANSYSTGGNSSSSSSNSSNSRNRGGSGSNWVRGNANQNMRRGMCHQYQRTGYCRNRNSGCPYIHER